MIALQASNNMYSRAYVEPSETLSDCLFADEDEECSDVDVDVEGVDICCPPSQGFRDLGELLEGQDSVSSNYNFLELYRTLDSRGMRLPPFDE